MKKCIIIVIIVAILSVAGTLLVQKYLLGPGTPVTPEGDTSFYPVTDKLDKGGDFYMYLNTEKVVAGVKKFVGNIRQVAMMEAKKDPKAAKEAEMGFNLLEKILTDLGLYEVDGVGISSVPIGDGFNHTTMVVHHAKGKGEGLMWHVEGEAPHDLDALKLLPENTVFAHFSDSNLPYLWKWLQKEAETSGIPQLAQGIKMLQPMLAQKGIDLEKLIGAHGGQDGFILTLDESKMCKLPVKEFPLEIPDPALAIVLYVNDDSVFELLKKFGPAPLEEKDGVKKISGPVVPLPITVQPAIAQKGNLLILASNNKILDDILAAQAGGKGLTAGEEFKKMAKGMPGKGNGFTFLSGKLCDRAVGLLEKAMAAAPDMDEEKMAAVKSMKILPRGLAVYQVKQVTPEGFISKSNNNLGMAGATLLPALAVGGIVAAIAIPNILTATQKGKQKATMGDIKTISMAVEAYIADNGKAPVGGSPADIREQLEPFYIKRFPMVDGWGHEFLYSSSGGDDYAIASAGKDGVFAGWDQEGFYVVVDVKGFGKDIILRNGMFVFGPKVK